MENDGKSMDETGSKMEDYHPQLICGNGEGEQA
jgi:hypothetical protein